MRIDRLRFGGRLRLLVPALTTIGLIAATSCARNLSMVRAIELAKLDGELAALENREEELGLSLRALQAPERIGPLARDLGLTDQWNARRVYAVAPAPARGDGLLAALWHTTQGVVDGLIGTREAYALDQR